MKHNVVGIGEIVWDLFDDGAKLGGAPANFAFHAGQFGLNSCVVSAVGDDELGSRALKELGDKGLNCKVQKADRPTGIVKVTKDEQGNASYEIREESAWDYISFTDELRELASVTDAVCFGTLAQRSEVSMNTIKRFVAAMPAKSLKVFDINLRQRYYTKQIIIDSFKLCNILKINDEELDAISSSLCYGLKGIEACRRLSEKYELDAVLYTLGENGSILITSDIVSELKAHPVEVVSTVGAGDSFTAAFVASNLKYGDPRAAHELAAQTASFVCTQQGAMPVLPHKITKAVKKSFFSIF